MPNIDQKEIKQLQKLSCISLSEQEEESLREDLEKIISHMDRLKNFDTGVTPPCVSVQQSLKMSPTRKDEIKDPLEKELFINNAPKSVGGMIQVPIVIDKEA